MSRHIETGTGSRIAMTLPLAALESLADEMSRAASTVDDISPLLPERLRERLPASQATAVAGAARVNALIGNRFKGFTKSLQAIVKPSRSVRKRLRELRALASEVSAIAQPMAACRKGCAHCCHIPVALYQEEADLIGDAISRPAVRLTQFNPPSERGYGYHVPFPFLVDSTCSIYAHRPLACRTHLNMDRDDLLCRLEADYTVPVPLLNLNQLHVAYVSVVGPGSAMGDIRDFFPEHGADAGLMAMGGRANSSKANR